MNGSAGHPSILYALGYGLITALTPCVYPMIPITVAVFGVKAGTRRARAIALATAYVAGISLMFGTLGTIFALSGKAFGTFLGNPWVIIPLAAFFIAMSLSMYGAFELNLPQGLQARLSRVGGAGFTGAFLMGLVGGLIAAPCTGPPLASLLLYVSTTRDVLWGFILLATFGAGVGAPFWLVAGFSMALPKPGAWMEWGKSFFGILFSLAALYYLENISPTLSRWRSPDPRFAYAMVGMVLAGLGLGAIHGHFYGGWFERVRKGIGVVLIPFALFGLNNYRLTPKGDIKLTWLTDEKAALTAARSSGHPLLIDFGANWCKPCKELEVKIFSRREIAELMTHYTLLKVDASNENDDPVVQDIRHRYESVTLPSIRIVSTEGTVVARAGDGVLPDPTEFRDLLFKKRF